MVPPNGFFPRYVQYASELTDAPEIYHVAAALAVHSAVCSNTVEVYFPTSGTAATAASIGDGIAIGTGGASVKLAWSPSHLWALLVGPSGDARKSTAINLAVETAKPLIEEQMSGEVSSPEATFDWVAKHPDCFFVYGEGASLFSMFNASYWQQGQGLFPRLYDGVDMKKKLRGSSTRTKKDPNPELIEFQISRPRVSLLVGVATSHLDAARSTDWTGGLIGRMVLIYAERDRFDPISGKTNDKEMLELRQILVDERAYLDSLQIGVLKLGMKAEAGKVYMEWAKQIDELQKRKGPKVRALYNRLPQHVMRIAAHYAVSQTHNVINLASVEAAIAFGNESVKSIDRISEILTDDRVVRSVVRLRDFLAIWPSETISYRQLMQQLHVSEYALRLPVSSLQANGEIRMYEDAKTKEKWISKRTPSERSSQK